MTNDFSPHLHAFGFSFPELHWFLIYLFDFDFFPHSPYLMAICGIQIFSFIFCQLIAVRIRK